MKRINYYMYNSSMGTLIDIEDKEDYQNNHYKEAINIPYETLLYKYKDYLDKNKPYFICCSKGIKSRKVVSILEFYGYNVTQVLK